jgi:hypothetical protein
VDAESLTIGEREIGAVNFTGHLEGQQASLQASAPKFNIKGNAEVQTEAPYPVEFKLAAEQTDLSTLAVNWKEGEPLTGVLSAAIEGSGELDNWRDGTAQAVISELQLNAGKQQVSNEGPLALRYEQRTVGVDGGLAVGDSHLRAKGSLPLEGSAPPGTVQLEGDLNLDTLVSLIPT